MVLSYIFSNDLAHVIPQKKRLTIAKRINRRGIVHREGEEWNDCQSVNPSNYTREICDKWGKGIEMLVGWRDVPYRKCSESLNSNKYVSPDNLASCS